MKIRIEELTGAALDWAVSKYEGGYAPSVDTDIDATKRINYGGMYPEWSTDWSHGGPIIEREGIELVTVSHDWRAMINTEDGWLRQYGPTPLVAAMRCYVASQLGDEVDIPLDLLIYETNEEE